MRLLATPSQSDQTQLLQDKMFAKAHNHESQVQGTLGHFDGRNKTCETVLEWHIVITVIVWHIVTLSGDKT